MKTIRFATASFILACSLFYGASAPAATVHYAAVTHQLEYFSGGSYTELPDATAIIRLEFNDYVKNFVVNDWASPDNTIVEFVPGQPLALGTYFYEVATWSVEFLGNASFMGNHNGNGGSFRWTTFDLGDGTQWQDDWAFLGPYGDTCASIPPFYWSELNYLDPSSSDYFKIQGPLWAGGTFSFGSESIGFFADFIPMPEPASLILLGTGLSGLIGLSRFRGRRKSGKHS